MDDEDIRSNLLKSSDVLVGQAAGIADDANEDRVDIGTKRVLNWRSRIGLKPMIYLKPDLVLHEVENALEKFIALHLNTIG